MNRVKSKIGARLNELMEQKHLNDKNLAVALHVDKKTVQSWRRGKTVPRLKHSILIIEYFHCSPDYLIGRTDIPYPSQQKQIK